MKKPSYAGRIKNQGSQRVQAPNGSSAPVRGNKRVTGGDLRGGRKDEKGGK